MTTDWNAGIPACMRRARKSDDIVELSSLHVAEAATLQAGMPALESVDDKKSCFDRVLDYF